jgi:hypothetical protein
MKQQFLLNVFSGLRKTVNRNHKYSFALIIAMLAFTFTGTSQWVKKIGGTNSDFGQAVRVDANGNVFVAGTFAGTADFDPGPAIFNLQSSCPCDVSNPPKSDIFLAKYDVNGNFIWAVNIGGSEADIANALVLDVCK